MLDSLKLFTARTARWLLPTAFCATTRDYNFPCRPSFLQVSWGAS